MRELCKELELERHEVIRWLKRNGHRAEELGRRYAEELNEDAEREARERARGARGASRGGETGGGGGEEQARKRTGWDAGV